LQGLAARIASATRETELDSPIDEPAEEREEATASKFEPPPAEPEPEAVDRSGRASEST